MWHRGSGGSSAIVPRPLGGILWVQNIFSWVFRGSQFFFRRYFVGPKFFLVGISWVQKFFPRLFRGLEVFFRQFPQEFIKFKSVAMKVPPLIFGDFILNLVFRKLPSVIIFMAMKCSQQHFKKAFYCLLQKYLTKAFYYLLLLVATYHRLIIPKKYFIKAFYYVAKTWLCVT